VEGLKTTMGYVGWIDKFEGEKGSGKERHFGNQIVKDLRTLGAIPLAKVFTVNIIVAPGDSN
jgi:amidase